MCWDGVGVDGRGAYTHYTRSVSQCGLLARSERSARSRALVSLSLAPTAHWAFASSPIRFVCVFTSLSLGFRFPRVLPILPSLFPLLSSGKHDCAKDIRSQASAGGGGVLKGRSHVLPPEFPSLSQVSLGLYV